MISRPPQTPARSTRLRCRRGGAPPITVGPGVRRGCTEGPGERLGAPVPLSGGGGSGRSRPPRLLDRGDVEADDHRVGAAAHEDAIERLVGLALISWRGTNGGTKMKSPWARLRRELEVVAPAHPRAARHGVDDALELAVVMRGRSSRSGGSLPSAPRSSARLPLRGRSPPRGSCRASEACWSRGRSEVGPSGHPDAVVAPVSTNPCVAHGRCSRSKISAPLSSSVRLAPRIRPRSANEGGSSPREIA
jgi:hypothetical protein